MGGRLREVRLYLITTVSWLGIAFSVLWRYCLCFDLYIRAMINAHLPRAIVDNEDHNDNHSKAGDGYGNDHPHKTS